MRLHASNITKLETLNREIKKKWLENCTVQTSTFLTSGDTLDVSDENFKKKNYHREIPKQVYATAGHITALKRTRKQRLMRDETTRQPYKCAGGV